MSIEEKIKARIAELEKARDELITQANQQVSLYQTSISELRALIEPEKPAEPEVVQEENKA